MKKWGLFLGLYFCFCLLAACGGRQDDAPILEEEPTCGPGVPYEMTCRIVAGADSGDLLLAEQDGNGIYTLNLSDTAKWKPDAPFKNGQLLTVRYQSILETWPGQFHEVSEVYLSDGGFDDRAALYLRVLEDLWEVDKGLNESGVEIIGVDVSATSLTPAEQSAVAWAFAENHNAEPIQATWEELLEDGYITAEPISLTGSGTDFAEPNAYFYEWKNGCFFSITEQPMEGVYSLVPVTFDAQKWRSSLGAYFFSNCTALQSATGEWSDYQIGSEMIS